MQTLVSHPIQIASSLLFLLVIFDLESATNGQSCVKTRWQSRRNHMCFPFTREAFTMEKISPSGGRIYIKLCCADRMALAYSKAVARSCQTTRCILPSERFNASSFPCSTLSKIIVDGQYIVNEESLRDECVHEVTGAKGVAAVCCPPNSLANLLISAYGAELNEFPHQARIKSGNEMCGGTVYNKDYVITAAHCVTEKDGNIKDTKQTQVVLGTNIGTLSSKANTFPVKRIIVHENFSLRKESPEFNRLPIPPKRIFNDVAVLQLARSINFSTQPNIRALPLAPPNFKPSEHADNVVVVGWGTTDNGLTTHHLQKANLLIRTDEQCFKPLLGGGPYANMKEFSPQLLCVGGILNGEFSPVAGRGDSGGPAICRGADGFAVLCGITSFGGDGDSCSENIDEYSCRPSAYADVSYFRDWIIKHAGPQQKEGLLKTKLYGDPVPEGQYEHQVHITSNKGPACGGTLVSRDTVVTAGHCVLMDDKSPRKNITITMRDGSTYKARSKGGVTGAPNFARYNSLENLNNRKSGKKSYLSPPYIDDIAVIKLERSVPISQAKLPKLPISSATPSKNTNAIELSIPLKPRKRLSQRKYRILDAKECQKRLEKLKVLGVEARFDATKIICGVETYSAGGICDRELGGGLICRNKISNNRANPGNDEQVLCGVQMFRLCDMSMPSAFVNVGRYKTLIEGAMRKN